MVKSMKDSIEITLRVEDDGVVLESKNIALRITKDKRIQMKVNEGVGTIFTKDSAFSTNST